MNLEYAAYLLNEDYSAPKLLLEDADSKGRKDATKWLKDNINQEGLGIEGDAIRTDDNGNPVLFNTLRGRDTQGSNAEYLYREAEMFFAHPLNHGLRTLRKGTTAFMPGAVRIAVSECGWFTKNANKKMLDNLRYIYAAIFFDFYDKRGPYNPDAQGHLIASHPEYRGLTDNNFDGRTYDELVADFGNLIPAAKERLEEQLRLPSTREGGEEEDAQQTTQRQRLAGQYHIEFIPDFETSKQWYKYTNPISEELGCHWCVTQTRGNWEHYHDCQHTGETIYYCWKAESKEALLEMNDHIYEYCAADAPHDEQMKAPHNEYGLSMLFIAVYPDSNGKVTFHWATSRYNHFMPCGEFTSEVPYAEKLVPEGDTQAICDILGISVDEFPRLFPIRSSGPVDHTDFVTKLVQYKEQNNLKGLFDELKSTSSYLADNEKRQYSSDNNFIIIMDQNEYNLITHDGVLVSPSKWFSEITQLTPNLVAIVEQESGMVNFLRGNGTYLLPREVLNYQIMQDAIGEFVNYAKIEVKPHLWNVVNLNTGAIILRKPVADVLLSNKYGRGIFVKKTPDSAWEQIDIKGKTIFKLANNNPDTKPLANIGNIALVQNQRKECSLINTTNGRTIWKKKYRNPRALSTFFNNCFVIIDDETGKSDYISKDGEILDTVNTKAVICTYTGDNSWVSNQCKKYIISKNNNGKFRIFDIENKEQVGPDKINRIMLLTSNYINYQDADSGEVKVIKNGETLEEPGNELYTYNKTVDAENEIYVVDTRHSGHCIFDGKTATVVSKLFNACDVGFDGNDGYVLGYKAGDNVYSLYDKSGEPINEEIHGPEGHILSMMRYIGHGCFLTEFDTGKSNIIMPNGKFMFKLPFTKMLGVGFNNEGIAAITAGRNQYVINTDGDVSRAIEALLECRLFMNHDNMLVD